MNGSTWIVSILTAVVGLALPNSIEAAPFVYISIAGENRIAVYDMDAESGALQHARDVPVSGSPGSLAVDPERQFLYAALRRNGGLAAFRIDAETGKLTLINKVPADANPAYVATDRTGRFLFSAYYGAGKAAVHRIAKSGALAERPLQTVATAPRAHAILTDASNQYAFVPHTGPNAIYQFLFDEKTGRLRPNAVPKVTTPENTGPRHLWFHPKQPQFAYASNEQGSSVTAYRLDRSTGRLSAFQTLSTLPDDFEGNNTCSHVELTPSGRYVYVANRGHDSLAGFAVNRETGKLTSLGQTPTEKTPRSFNVTPSGRFVYAAGQASGKVAAYRLDAETGRLKRFDTYEVGPRPWWVLTVRPSAK